MSRLSFARNWGRINPAFLPFADAASAELPLGRLLRLSLFQVTVGMAVVLVIGTLNRVMIVELGVPAWLVAVMISLPLILAPYRAVIGFKSDTHRSVLGWRRLPYLWKGTLLQFGGLAIMPFSLMLLSGDTTAPPIFGQAAAALAFLLVGAGLHTVQTIGLALATDIAPQDKHPQVVTLLCGMLLVGMVVSAVAFGIALHDFSPFRLIQVIQAAAVVTMFLNFIALWKQEARNPAYQLNNKSAPKPPAFREAWSVFMHEAKSVRALVVVGLGTFGFQAQDVLLEPFGGQILHLAVGTTTILTALLAVGGLCGFALSARLLNRGMPPYRLAAIGVLGGIVAFSCVLSAARLYSAIPFGLGTALIGFGSALFIVGTLSAAMGQAQGGLTGLALGTWGAVQAFAAGAAIALGGVVRDIVSALAEQGVFGPSLAVPVTGYGVVYGIEIVMLVATLVALAPLVRPAKQRVPTLELTT
ncbi:Protein PucC [Rhodovastum atsumiense]|uniref:BCD family MFS transporter n=1 Tax=Rhodovastum atsumiense TaxID=504468 RepID=A0A5M6IX58_9PROT|nr:BCD family MFS transporter [Rhodovastum atsumiense]KAA5612903.1 BCD family MFS transporter [Rhodovastum atsumiense]CAH2601015.1 Protein PucC [Rhodovastum atsumiense]